MNTWDGRWKAEARQATFNETPIRKVSPGDIADIVIEPNGRGHSFKKGLFGQKELPFTWQKMTDNIYIIDLGNGFTMLCNYIPELDKLTTVWNSPINSVDGMAVYYSRA